MSYIAYPPESHNRMLEIKAKSRRDKNIFNADQDVKIGSTEATTMNRNAGTSRPAVLCPPRRSSLVLGVEPGGYSTEASTQYNSGQQPSIRESYKPQYISVPNNRVVLRGNTPDENRTTAQNDFKNHQHSPTKRNKVWGNKSNVEFHSGHDGGFVTEAKSAFGGVGGRPATSFKPAPKLPPTVIFDSQSSAAAHFQLPPGHKYVGRASKPHAARSEITEQQLIQSVESINQIAYGTEATSNYALKNRVENQRVYRKSQGIGFGGGQEDRDFSCEGRTQYNKKERIPVDKHKWTEPRTYVRVDDDRDFNSETKAQHTHGGPPVSTLRKKQMQAAPVVQAAPIVQQQIPPPQSARQQSRQSQQASRQPSRGSQRGSRAPTAQPAAQVPEYIPTISLGQAQPQSNSRMSNSKRQSQYSRPGGSKGIAPVTRAKYQQPAEEPQSQSNSRRKNRMN